MTTVMGQTKHLHGLGNLKVPREMMHRCLKAEQRNINHIDALIAWFDMYISSCSNVSAVLLSISPIKGSFFLDEVYTFQHLSVYICPSVVSKAMDVMQ